MRIGTPRLLSYILFQFTLRIQFSNLQDLSEIWSTTNTNTQHFPYTVSNEELDANGPDAELETLLNYPLPTEYPLSTFVYETKDEVTASPDSSQPQAPM